MLSKTISHESLTHFLLVSPYLMLVLKIEKVNGPVRIAVNFPSHEIRDISICFFTYQSCH